MTVLATTAGCAILLCFHFADNKALGFNLYGKNPNPMEKI